MCPPPCSMQDIARRFGVHPSTVSRALRNDPTISQDMRERVQAAARDLGYKPNPLISALVRSRRPRRSGSYRAHLGYLFAGPVDRARVWRRNYDELFFGAKARANMLGYELEEFDLSGRDLSPKRFTQILLTRNIHGLILPPLYSLQDSLPVEWDHFGVIAIGHSHRIPANRVVHNHFAAMRTALAACRARGRQRIGLVLTRRLHEKVEKLWLASYVFDHFEQADRCEARPLLLMEDRNDAARFDVWLKQNRPDAIIGLQNLTPIHAWVKTAGLASEIELVTLDYHESDRGFSGIFHDYGRIGATAVDQLVGQLERNERGLPRMPVSTLIDGVWIERATDAQREKSERKK